MMLRPSKLGHIVLKVCNLQACVDFYSRIIGLEITHEIDEVMVFLTASGTSSHELALMAVGENVPISSKPQTGLYHFAWQMNSFENLQEICSRIKQHNVPILGVGDHGISIGIYVHDPEKNEIEVFYELPSSERPDADIFTGTFPRSLDL